MFVPDRLAITVAGVLLSVAACSWVATYYLMPFMTIQSGVMSFGVAAIVASPSLPSVSIFEIIWIVGMAAMMFPAMTPIVLFYNKIATKQEPNPSVAKSIGTPLFLGGYLTIYAALGACAYAAVYAAVSLSNGFSDIALISAIAAGAILVAAGLYQFTPLKTRCLKNCISPIGFFAVHYKTGLLGSLRMGLTHGYICVGCCWAFMLVMLGVGAMSIPVMALLAGVVAGEKVLARGAAWFSRVIGIGFILAGTLVVLFPDILARI